MAPVDYFIYPGVVIFAVLLILRELVWLLQTLT